MKNFFKILNPKKYNFLIYFSFILSFSLYAQPSDWEKYELKGKVKKVEANTGFYKGRCAQTIKYSVYTCITSFDEKGNILKNTWLMSNRIEQEQIFSYKKNWVILDIIFYDDNENILNTKKFYYKKGKKSILDKGINDFDIFSFDFYQKNILWEYSKATFDDFGNWITKENENENCIKHSFRTIEYY